MDINALLNPLPLSSPYPMDINALLNAPPLGATVDIVASLHPVSLPPFHPDSPLSTQLLKELHPSGCCCGRCSASRVSPSWCSSESQWDSGTASPLQDVLHNLKGDMDCESTEDIASGSSGSGRRKPYYVFSHHSYNLMSNYLSLASPRGHYPTKAEIVGASVKDLSRKRWRRLQGNVQLIVDAPLHRNLSWVGTSLVIIPKEDWRDVFMECHLTMAEDGRRAYHHGIQETYHKLKSKYQTRRSRCGITYEDLLQLMSECPCKPNTRCSHLSTLSSDKMRPLVNEMTEVHPLAL